MSEHERVIRLAVTIVGESDGLLDQLEADVMRAYTNHLQIQIAEQGRRRIGAQVVSVEITTARMDGCEPSAVIVSPWDLEAFDRAHGDGEALRTLWSLPILVSRDIPIGTAKVVRYDLALDVARVEASIPPAKRHIDVLVAELRALRAQLADDDVTLIVRQSLGRHISRVRQSLASAIELVDVLEQRRTMLRQQIKEGGRE